MSNFNSKKKEEKILAPQSKLPSLQARWFEAHSISGSLILIPLFIILFTGTISFFQKELRAWHTPALQLVESPPLRSVDQFLEDKLEKLPRNTQNIFIKFPDRWEPVLSAKWRIPNAEESHSHVFNPINGDQISNNALSSEFAHHLYVWHFLHPLPMGINIAGAIALIWFALAISGVYMNRNKFIPQFKSWRVRKGRAFQSCIHTVSATITLPLHLIYGITGTYFGAGIIVIPIIALIAFDGDQIELRKYLSTKSEPKFTNTTVEVIPSLDPFILSTYSLVPRAKLLYLSIQKPFDEGAEAHVYFEEADGGRGEAIYRLHEGSQPINVIKNDDIPAGINILRTVLSLHYGDFGGILLKIIYTIGGLILCVLTYAGARMWIERKSRALPRWAIIYERLFDGFALGLLPAVGIFALANRILPYSIQNRGSIEILIFHSAWLIIAIIILAIGTSHKCRRVLIMSTIAILGTIPFLDGVLFNIWPWQTSSWIVPSVAITNIILLTLFFGFTAIMILNKKVKSSA